MHDASKTKLLYFARCDNIVFILFIIYFTRMSFKLMLKTALHVFSVKKKKHKIS